MADVVRPSGLTVRTPERYRDASAAEPAGAVRRGPRGRLASGPVPMPGPTLPAGETDVLLNALQDQERELVDQVELVRDVDTGPAGGTRRAPPGSLQETELELVVNGDEDAV